MTKKRKRATIGSAREEAIAQFVSEFPHLSRTRLAEKIQAKVKWLGKAPEIEVLERKISHYRRRLKSPDREDQRWSMGTPSDYSITPEALPTVFAVCKYARDNGNVFTIRQAKWAARLSGVLRDQSPSALWDWTCRYAGAECVSRLLNRPFDTVSLDSQLMGLPSPQEGDTESREWQAKQHEKALSQMAARGESQIIGNLSIPSKTLAMLENREGEQSKKHNRTKRQTREKKGDKK